MHARIVSLLFLSVTFLRAEGWGKESLKGIQSFGVDVILEDGCENAFSETSIRSWAEQQLRKLGIRIAATWTSEPASSDLRVSISCVRVSMDPGSVLGWAVFDDVSVMQVVHTTGGSNTLGITWSSAGRLHTGTAAAVSQGAARDIAEQTQAMLNDYLSINPRRASP
jgi:hypothetical protein